MVDFIAQGSRKVDETQQNPENFDASGVHTFILSRLAIRPSQYLSCVKNNSMKKAYFLAKVAEFWAVAHTPSDHISMPSACLHDDCTGGLITKLEISEK